MKLLCTGDLHIGRRSSRVPDGGDGLSTTSCWGRIVDLALDRRVDAVLLTGDLVERANRFFEAVGPLERGLERLRRAAIPVVAVAGNHDFDVLPGIADALGGNAFRLLGRGGTWETAVLETAGGRLRVTGWSFPAEHVKESPVRSLALPDDGLPAVGLLHCDLDAAASLYAPVAAQVLRAQAVGLWLLGHIHMPLRREEQYPPILYVGSPQAMDPGEPGAHGAWLVEMDGQGLVTRSELVPLSSVRYDVVEVSAEGCTSVQEAEERVILALRQHRAALAEVGSLSRLSCRVRLVGPADVARLELEALRQRRGELSLGDEVLALTVDDVAVETRPAVRLDELARTDDACGVLSRLVLALDAGEAGEFDALLGEAQAEARRVHLAPGYVLADGVPPEGTALRSLVRAQALELLDTLLRQREVRP